MTLTPARIALRARKADEHFAAESAHDTARTVRTFEVTPTVVLNGAALTGEAVRGFYDQVNAAFPDFRVEKVQRYVSDEAIHDEVVLRGTHRGTWQGIPATGRTLALPACVVFVFDAQDRLLMEKAWFDGATMLQQLGVLGA